MGGVESAVPRVASSNDPYQHEQRFLLTRAQAASFFAAVARHTRAETYDDGRPISYTRTSYFDTDALDYFRSCAGPHASRLRVREYASAASLEDTPILGLSFLELKTNTGSDRTKFRITAASATLRLLIQRREFPFGDNRRHDLRRRIGKTLRQALAAPTLAPRLTTWYRRDLPLRRRAARAESPSTRT